MGLDANIFFQGAALRQASDARTQAAIGNIFDKLEAKKIREQDPERMLRQAVARKISGEATPEDEKLIQFESVLKGGETKYMPDEFGNVRAVTQPTLYDRLYGAGGQQPYQPQYPAMGEMNEQFTGQFPTMDINQDAVSKVPASIANPLMQSDVFAGGEKGIDLNRIANARIENAARVNMPASDVSPIMAGNEKAYIDTTPFGKKERYSADIDLEKKANEKQIDTAQKQVESNISGLRLKEGVTPTDTQRNELVKIKAAYDQLRPMLEDYKNTIKNVGTPLAGTASATELGGKAANIRMTLKELEGLGALQQPDITAMEAMMGDTTLFGGTVGDVIANPIKSTVGTYSKITKGKEMGTSSADRMLSYLDEKMKSQAGARGYEFTPSPKEAPKTKETDVESLIEKYAK